MAYGRQPDSAGLCPGTNTNTNNCVQFDDVIGYISHCYGQRCCTIAATNAGLGSDPCVGTTKYPGRDPAYCKIQHESCSRLGSLTYTRTDTCQCKWPVASAELHSSDTYRQAICELSSGNICCPGDTRIRISSAGYGRQPGSAGLCPTSTNSCIRFNEVTNYVAHCNGQACCTITATNDRFGGDPCYGIGKYAVVTWTCS
ncbi:PREDICTED: L-rhamnose-binding lectin CSL3-like [Priapulus caudatus]|uniref:L-rhamnose-binding lectin CSL3-like n=1 Tax=Priapulus caudatus TaxID=37621 RepID=A0ABM1F636_PRICU|nr:PREDICTED: L-rhamnose-binding lectin CSL3-like [Priapulus caudatus]